MKINNPIKLIYLVYILALLIFLIFRIILFVTEFDRVDFQEVSLLTIFQSFIMGIRFDTVISGYVLILPALLLIIGDFFQVVFKSIKAFSYYWIAILFSFIFSISAVDIPYFNHFNDRFTVGAFKWIEHTEFVMGMITSEPSYYLIIIPFIIVEILFVFALKRLFFNYNPKKSMNVYISVITRILFLGVIFLGIRGRIQKKSPIRIGTAYFSDHSFLNKLGLNPSFTFFRSYLDSQSDENSQLNLIDKKEAESLVKSYLNIDSLIYSSPVARVVSPVEVNDSLPNVVLIIMESMSADKLNRHNPSLNLTPFLDSLTGEGLYFDHLYTTGKHTFNGIFSTLFSFPALYRQHPLKYIRKYDGAITSLLDYGYSTTYFTTHDGQFDNVEGFLRANDFQNIVSQRDYPSSEVKTNLGVPDDYMFRYSIPILNGLANKGAPFFATFMTASDHGPYYVPKYFRPHSKDVKQQIVEYADWSLKKFISLASQESWYKNTLFVFVADHGGPLNITYDIPLNYFHSPLLFYGSYLDFDPTVSHNMASQMDVMPTLMGMLNIPYVNNTMGIDLCNEDRPYALINDDDKIGVIDSSWLCIIKEKGSDLHLYNYPKRDKVDYINEERVRAKKMADYGKSMMQVYQNMIIENQLALKQ